MKKVVSLVLAATLSLGILSGCSNSSAPGGSSGSGGSSVASGADGAGDPNVNKTGFPIVNETITLKGLVAQNINVGDWNEHPALAYMEELTNIHIDWESVPDAGFKEKMNLAFASNQLPDLMMRCRLSSTDEMKYASNGQIIALSDYKEYAPNFYALLEEYPTFEKSTALPDGRIYSLPQINFTEGNLIQHQWINKQWLDNLGLPMPTTTDELYETLVAFRDQDPNGNGQKDEIPYIIPCKDSPARMFVHLLGSFGLCHNGAVNSSDREFSWLEVDKDGKVNFVADQDKFKALVEYLNKLWSEGLIDPECYALDDQQVAAKANAGQMGYTARAANTQWIGAVRDNYVQHPVLEGPFGDRDYTFILGNVQTTGTAVITSANKYPEATLRWLDYFYSEEGTVLVRFGLEGKSYDVIDGKYVLRDEIQNNPDGLTLDQALGKWSLFPGGVLPQCITDEVDASAAQLPETKAANDVVREYLAPGFERVPTVKYTDEESKQLSTYQQDIMNYAMENTVKFITGERPMSDWDAYVAEYEKMPVDDYVAINQAAYDRWNSVD